jgi:hypothetical protein
VNVVIDTRRIEGVTLDAGRQTVTVGAGASLGAVYKASKAPNLHLLREAAQRSALQAMLWEAASVCSVAPTG